MDSCDGIQNDSRIKSQEQNIVQAPSVASPRQGSPATTVLNQPSSSQHSFSRVSNTTAPLGALRWSTQVGLAYGSNLLAPNTLANGNAVLVISTENILPTKFFLLQSQRNAILVGIGRQ